MVILKLDSDRTADDIAYSLRGKRFGKHVIVYKHDQCAIDLAIALTSGKLIYQSQIASVLALLALGILLGQGIISVGIWANVLPRSPQVEDARLAPDLPMERGE